MKTAIKSGLVSGSFFGAAWLVILSPAFIGLGVTGHMFLSIAIAGSLFVGAGLPFGLAMGVFAAYQKKGFLAMGLVPEGETLVHQGGANHFVGLEGVGGWLYLTDHALRFKSHEINIQRHQLAIALQDVSEAISCRTAWVLPNGLLVRTRDGHSERFVVSGRRTWVSSIMRAKMDAEHTGAQDGASAGVSSAPVT